MDLAFRGDRYVLLCREFDQQFYLRGYWDSLIRAFSNSFEGLVKLPIAKYLNAAPLDAGVGGKGKVGLANRLN